MQTPFGKIALIAVLLVSAGCATNRPRSKSVADESLLDRLPGHWVLTGAFDGKEANHDVDAEWVLRKKYLRLHEVSRNRTRDGQPDYEAIVLIEQNPRSKECGCLWLDSTVSGGLTSPVTVIGRGKPKGSAIPFVFQFSGDVRFNTTFIYASDTDSWQWIMDSEEKGKIEPFGRATLVRKK